MWRNSHRRLYFARFKWGSPYQAKKSSSGPLNKGGIFKVFGLSVILSEVFSKVGEEDILGGVTAHSVSESLGTDSESKRTWEMFDSMGGD